MGGRGEGGERERGRRRERGERHSWRREERKERREETGARDSWRGEVRGEIREERQLNRRGGRREQIHNSKGEEEGDREQRSASLEEQS